MKIVIALILAMASTLAFGQNTAVQTWNPENIVWQRTDSDGTKWAVLEGDKDAPVRAFTYAFFLPAAHWEHHFHTQDARVAVVSGALKVAVGPELDKTGSKDIPGGKLSVRAGQRSAHDGGRC